LRAGVFLNGSPDPPALIRRVADRADVVVAADGGARHALEAGVIPDLIVGDMDSLGEELALEAQRRGASLERHPARKDRMDGHLAVLAARELGVDAADLVCASGGRISALLALPHVLLAAERAGLKAAVMADWGGAFVIEGGSRTLEGEPQDGVSIFPLSGPATGVTLQGLLYPLRDASLEPGDTLGFHNEMTGREATVSVRSGVLLVVRETGEVCG
jgi:thiamine pyrophosphokinase